MKTLVTLLKSIFVPFSTFAFLILGIVACFCSGIIEYYVFQKILSTPGLGIDSSSWAALLVFVLEGSKFTLHFYSASLSKKNLTIDDFNIIAKKRSISRAKNALIILSVICSIICFINVLYNDHDAKIQRKVQAINADCDQKLSEGSKILLANKNDQINYGLTTLKKEEDNIAYLQSLLTDVENRLKTEPYQKKRSDLQEEAAALRTDISNALSVLATHTESINQSAETTYQTELAMLENKYGDSGSERIVDTSSLPPEILQEGDNPYLSNFLLSISKTFGRSSYSRSTYFIVSLMFSLIVSLILEWCISLSQTLLTIRVESFLLIIGELPKIEKGKKFVQFFVWLLFSILIATSVYLVITCILHTTIQPSNLKNALLTYGVTVILLNALMPKPKQNGSLTSLLVHDTEKQTLFVTVYSILFEAFIPAALSFIIFMLLGFIFNGKFNYTDLNSIAVAAGGLCANALKYKQCEFFF